MKKDTNLYKTENTGIFKSIIFGVLLFASIFAIYKIITSAINISVPNAELKILLSATGLIVVWGIYGFFAVIHSAKTTKKTIDSILELLFNPEGVRIEQVRIVLSQVMEKEITILEKTFDNMTAKIEEQHQNAIKTQSQIETDNKHLTETANKSTENFEKITENLAKNIDAFKKLVESDKIKSLMETISNFEKNISEIYDNTSSISKEVFNTNDKMISGIKELLTTNKTLSDNMNQTFDSSSKQFNSFIVDMDAFNQKLAKTMGETTIGFKDVQAESKKLNTLLNDNKTNLEINLESLKTYTSQTLTTLQSHVREIDCTVKEAEGRIRLTESSLTKQEQGLQKVLMDLMEYAKTMEDYIRGVSTEITALTVKMQGQMKEFSNEVVKNMQEVNLSATTTLSETDQATKSFSKSVQDMSSTIQESMESVSKLHEKLTTDAVGLINISKETTEQLSPMAGIISSYNQVLPKISNDTKGFLNLFSEQITTFENKSKEAVAEISSKIATLDVQINSVKNSAKISSEDIVDMTETLKSISEKSVSEISEMLNNYKTIAGQLEQTNTKMNFTMAKQKIMTKESELNLDSTVQENPNVAKMDLIADKLHEVSREIAMLTGTTISDVVWQRYNSGDKSIFSDWLSKMLEKADKGKIKAIIKSDDNFRQKSSSFIKGFERILDVITLMENSGVVRQRIMNTTLGSIYSSLKKYL